MGMNTTLLLLNDFAGDIERNPERFAARIVTLLRCGEKLHLGQGTTLVTMDHADVTSLIAVGGNCFTVLGRFNDAKHHDEEGQIDLLHRLADQLGFQVKKKE